MISTFATFCNCCCPMNGHWPLSSRWGPLLTKTRVDGWLFLMRTGFFGHIQFSHNQPTKCLGGVFYKKRCGLEFGATKWASYAKMFGTIRWFLGGTSTMGECPVVDRCFFCPIQVGQPKQVIVPHDLITEHGPKNYELMSWYSLGVRVLWV